MDFSATVTSLRNVRSEGLKIFRTRCRTSRKFPDLISCDARGTFRPVSGELRPDGFNARSELIVKLDIRRQSEVMDVGTDVADKGLGVKWNVSSWG